MSGCGLYIYKYVCKYVFVNMYVNIYMRFQFLNKYFFKIIITLYLHTLTLYIYIQLQLYFPKYILFVTPICNDKPTRHTNYIHL